MTARHFLLLNASLLCLGLSACGDGETAQISGEANSTSMRAVDAAATEVPAIRNTADPAQPAEKKVPR